VFQTAFVVNTPTNIEHQLPGFQSCPSVFKRKRANALKGEACPRENQRTPEERFLLPLEARLVKGKAEPVVNICERRR
jgi:hypothetical protein